MDMIRHPADCQHLTLVIPAYSRDIAIQIALDLFGYQRQSVMRSPDEMEKRPQLILPHLALSTVSAGHSAKEFIPSYPMYSIFPSHPMRMPSIRLAIFGGWREGQGTVKN
jgi:hypothetical protein